MGGHGAGVTEQLNYRRSQARKRPGQEKTYGSLKNGGWEDSIKASPEQILAIRLKLKKERRRKRILRVIVFLGLLVLAMVFITILLGN